MSTPLVDAGSSQWDASYIDLFDQSADGFAVPNIDWNLDLGGLEDNPHVTSPAHDVSTPAPHGISAGETAGDITPERGAEMVKTAKRKGRPISSSNDSQSAADRRRTQVRLAQRAYRNRKETTVISLRKDVEDLKTRLHGMEIIADELFELTCSAPYASKDTFARIQALRKKQVHYRLPIHMRSSTQAEENTAMSIMDDAALMSPSSSAGSIISTNRKFLGGELGNNQNSAQFSHPNYYIDQHSSIHDAFQDPQFLQPRLASSFSSIGIFNSSLLKFSLWLRHAALKGAYALAEKPETPYKVLFEVFRYCIFSSTRDDILRHLDGLIQDCAKTTYQNMATMITDVANNPSDGSFSPPPYYTEAESATRGTEDAYMGPEGVTNYLQERGLAIDPDLSYAELTMKPGNLFGSVPSLFDEIRQHRKIRVSVEKLRDELLSRMVCLEVGPGIRVSKIDEAIRSTVIAVI